MNRLSEQAQYVPELPRNAELLRISGIRLQRIHFFDDASLDVREVLSQVRTPLPLDLFSSIFLSARNSSCLCGKCSGCSYFQEAIR
ncbi:hypothetical protein [Citrobacter sp. wls717]|uniref:hypothetical protein n=1 Tax=Citrobacter sp. wls717 TaxID=2576419 RepID=UPI00201810FD|nr:hypothetical protein [Citrobacter sp. wls717]